MEQLKRNTESREQHMEELKEEKKKLVKREATKDKQLEELGGLVRELAEQLGELCREEGIRFSKEELVQLANHRWPVVTMVW